MNRLPVPNPLVVVILDGWGQRVELEGNPIASAATPIMDMFLSQYPSASLAASGLEVGLPAGVVGNSEAGHRNIGAGRVEYQIMSRIDMAIEDKSFFRNKRLLAAIEHAREHNSSLHIMGLLSSGGVHAHTRHLFAILEMLAKEEFRERVYVHVFTDGRDAPLYSAPGYVRQLEEAIGKYGVGTIASVTGRYFAMDRNENWERTKLTYDMLTGGDRPPGAPSPQEALSQSYDKDLTDKTVPTTAITRGGQQVAEIRDNDAIVFFNFRPDRARQLTRAFVSPEVVGFPARKLENIFFVTLAEYDAALRELAAFDEEVAEWPLARVISVAGLKQLHIAETEKYAHMTYYLNVGREEPFPGEVHDLVHSSKEHDYVQDPQMEAGVITDRVVNEVEQGKYEVIFVNYANADMVGHTGNLEAAKAVCEFLDQSVNRLVEAALAKGGALIVTADHGKVEKMISDDGRKELTEHTDSLVPFHYVRRELMRTTPKSEAEINQIKTRPVGVLADVAPTVLDILQLKKPPSMTGISLLGSLR